MARYMDSTHPALLCLLCSQPRQRAFFFFFPFSFRSFPFFPFGQAVARASNFAAVGEPDAIARWRWRCGEQKQKGSRALTLPPACGRVVEGAVLSLRPSRRVRLAGRAEHAARNHVLGSGGTRRLDVCPGRAAIQAGRQAGRISAGLGVSPARTWRLRAPAYLLVSWASTSSRSHGQGYCRTHLLPAPSSLLPLPSSSPGDGRHQQSACVVVSGLTARAFVGANS
jgi:hypothetical protein